MLALPALFAPCAALACGVPAPGTAIFRDSDGHVAPGGILLGQHAEQLAGEIRVVDAEGVEHPGTWETLGRTAMDSTGRWQWFSRWIPEQPLAAGAYQVISSEKPTEPLTIDVPDEPPAQLELAPSYTLEARAHGEGSEFACPGDSCSPPLYTRTRKAPHVDVLVPTTPDWAFPRVLARLVTEIDGHVIRGDFRDARALESEFELVEDGLYSPADAAEYCVTFEVLDILDGALHQLDRTCLEAGATSGRQDTAVAPFAEDGCLNYASLPPGYENAWCKDNVECADSDEEACSGYADRCADDADAGADDADDGADDADDDVDNGSDEQAVEDAPVGHEKAPRASSCSLSSTPSGAGWAWFVGLALLAIRALGPRPRAAARARCDRR